MSSMDFIKFPLNVLSTLGLSIPTKSKDQEKSYRFQSGWLLPLAVLNTIYSAIGQTTLTKKYLERGEKLWTVAAFVFTFVYQINAMAKLFLILYERKCFNDLLINLDDIFPKTQWQQRDYRLKHYLHKFIRLAVSLSFLQIAFGQYIGWSKMVVAYFEMPAANRTFELQLPFGEESPFYSYTPISFAIVFISQFWQAYICCAPVYAVNLIVCGLISQIQMHYDHLHWKLVSFSEPEPGQSDYDHLIWCIEKQNQLNLIFYRLNDACAMATLVGIYCGCFELALFSFMGMHISHWNDVVKNIFGAMSACMELFTLCLFSQRITDSVRAVNEATYHGDWINKPMIYKKAMIIMIHQNQRTILLKAYKFTDLSMETFSTILNFSYKLVMLLNNFN